MWINKVKAIRNYEVTRLTGVHAKVIASNILKREFQVPQPNPAWVTDIT